jgi:hypothetical protein
VSLDEVPVFRSNLQTAGTSSFFGMTEPLGMGLTALGLSSTALSLRTTA